MGLLSFFFESNGFEVHNVIVLDEIAYPYAGKLLNLGKLKGKSNDVFDKASRFMALRKFLRAERFDAIIDFRIRVSFMQEFFISRVLYNAPAFYTVHSSNLDWYFPILGWQARLVYGNAAGIVAVSNGVKTKIEAQFGLKNVSVIPNAISLENIISKSGEPIGTEEQFIVSAGRMDDDIKQFDKLMEAYSRSVLPQKGIKLVLLGEGKLRPKLERDAPEGVIFKGFVQNPYAYFSKAMFFVLSSKAEGLPMVILESLASGTPVVSFDCVSGPGEMIEDGRNGILVADQDFNKLVEAMDKFALNEDFLASCQASTRASVKAFSLEKIGRRWLDYLKIM